MSRPNKKNTPSQPLYTISQKPGKEDSSFIGPDDEQLVNTASLPLSSQFSANSNSIEHPVSNPKKKPSQKGAYKQQRSRIEKSKKNQPQYQHKIYVSSQSFDVDFKLVSQAFDQELKESITKWQQQENLTEDQIDIVVNLLQQAKKEAFQKVIYNTQVVGRKSSKEEIVPIQVSLSRNVYRLNQINLENLKLASERVAQEKPFKEQIHLNPQIPSDQQISVLMKDGSVMSLDDYIKSQASINLDKQIHQFEEYEKFVLKTQKNFIQCVGLYDKINGELAQELRNLKQGSKKKQSPFIKFK